MPGGINGVQLAEAVRSEMPDLPILLTSGYAAPFAKEASAAGVRLLAKPFALDALAAAIGQTRMSLAARAIEPQ